MDLIALVFDLVSPPSVAPDWHCVDCTDNGIRNYFSIHRNFRTLQARTVIFLKYGSDLRIQEPETQLQSRFAHLPGPYS